MDSKSLRFITHQSFFSAVRSDDLEALKNLFENEGSDPSSLMALQNEEKATALYIAAENNFLEVFMYLLGFCDVDSVMMRAKSDMDAFQVAASKGHLDIVRELLKKWPHLCRVCNSSNTSPLYLAASQNHLEVVNAILDVDVSTARIVRKNGKTALHTTGRYGQLDIVKALIERDPGMIPIKDKKGQTALHMAVKGQDTCVVEELLEADHSILNERDKKGNTALHIATRKSRSQIVTLLLTYRSIDVNAVNNQRETSLDIADRLQFGPHALEITVSLSEAGAKRAATLSSNGQYLESAELNRTVSHIRHEVQSQLIQTEKTHRRVSGIAKELRKIHREAVQNTINSVTVVAVLVASIAFIALFNLPGQYQKDGPEAGQARIARTTAFRAFCLLDSTALFISLSVVVVQITLVAWDTRAQKRVVSVVNKMMWAACMSTCGAFLAISFVVVGRDESWMADMVSGLGGPILVGTLASLCFFVFRKHFGSDSQRRIRRGSGSKSFSWSYSVNMSDLDDEYNSEEKIYAL